MTLSLRFAARSDRGLLRSNNQDSVYAGPRLLAIADGVGGNVAGEVASKIVIAAMEPLDHDASNGDLLKALEDATHSGTMHLRESIEAEPDLEGMGTTLTALLFAGNRVGLCHIGDSRGYLLRESALSQITHDHSFVQTLVDEGRITQEEAHSHPQRSLILRALNGTDQKPDLSVREVRAGDRYLLCSDGLSDVVTSETIHEALLVADTEECADRLIELALRGGGPDNVTVIVADVVDDQHTSDLPVVGGAAGDHAGARAVSASSAAGRAALANPNREPEQITSPIQDVLDPDDVARHRKRRRRRGLIGLVVVLALLAGGAYALRAYVLTQYWVGVESDQVVIYNGVDVTIGPLELYSLAEETDIALDDLNQAAQADVQGGITADSLQSARDIVERLLRQRLPLCKDTGEKAAPSSSGAASTTEPPFDPNAPPPPSSAPPSSSASASASGGATSTEVPGETCRTGP